LTPEIGPARIVSGKAIFRMSLLKGRLNWGFCRVSSPRLGRSQGVSRPGGGHHLGVTARHRAHRFLDCGLSAFQNYAESARCDVEAAGLPPDTICVRDPETVIVQAGVGDEVFAAPSNRIEAVGETAECGDRHRCCKYTLRSPSVATTTGDRSFSTNCRLAPRNGANS